MTNQLCFDELVSAAKKRLRMRFLPTKTWQKKGRKLIIFTVNGKKSSFLLTWKKTVCVSSAVRLWRRLSGTTWRDISVHVTKATMLTTHQAAHYGRKSPWVKGSFGQTAVFFYEAGKKNSQKATEATCQCHGKDKLKYWNTVTDVLLSVTDVMICFNGCKCSD